MAIVILIIIIKLGGHIIAIQEVIGILERAVIIIIIVIKVHVIIINVVVFDGKVSFAFNFINAVVVSTVYEAFHIIFIDYLTLSWGDRENFKGFFSKIFNVLSF